MNQLTHTQRQISARFVAFVTLVAMLLSAFPASFFVANAQEDSQPEEKIEICKAANSDENTFQLIEVNKSSILNQAGIGEGGLNVKDIIPGFGDFAGMNLGSLGEDWGDLSGLDLLKKHRCEVPVPDDDEPVDPAPTGEIRVCKLIVDENGDIVDGTGLSSLFELDIDGPDGFEETVEFTTSLTLDVDLVSDNGLDYDAECTLLEDLAPGKYTYADEVITGDDWEAPRYHDYHNDTPDELSDFGEMVAEGGEGVEYQKNFDGSIELEADETRTIAIVNTVKKDEVPELEIPRQCTQVVDEFSVPADNGAGTDSSLSLDAGRDYFAVVSGTYTYRSDNGELADAEYSKDDTESSWVKEFSNTRPDDLDLLIDGSNPDFGAFRADHTYGTLFTGTGAASNFAIQDAPYSDNTGSIDVTLYECEPDEQPELVCEIGENLLDNGSFEITEVPEDGKLWDRFLAAATGWMTKKVSDEADTTLEIHRGWSGNEAAHQDQYAELDGDEPVRISQTIATIPGATYELKWAFAPRQNTAAAENHLSIQVNGDEITTNGPQSGIGTLEVADWTYDSLEFTADGDSTEIAFADLGPEAAGNGPDVGTFLDAAQLCFVAEPEECEIDFSVDFANDTTVDGYETTGENNPGAFTITEITGGYQVALRENTDNNDRLAADGVIAFTNADLSGAVITKGTGNEKFENGGGKTGPDSAEIIGNTVAFDLQVTTADDVFTITGIEKDCDDEEPVDPQVCSAAGEVVDYTDPAYKNNGDEVDADRRDVSGVENGVAPYSNFGGKEPSWSTDDFFSLGIGGELTYEFTDKVAVNQPGPDIAIWEITGGNSGQSNEKAEVFLSEDGVNFESAGQVTGDGTVDIADTSLSEVRFVKLVDQSDGVQGGNGDGFDVDAITIIAGSCEEGGEPELSLEITNPAVDGQTLFGEHMFEAEYTDDDDTVDTINWAIKPESCQANTPGQNLAGFGTAVNPPLTYDPVTGAIDVTVDLSEYDPGEYCFVVNPQETGGQTDTPREVRTFVIEEPQVCELEILSDGGTLIEENNWFATSTFDGNNAWTAEIFGDSTNPTWVWEAYEVADPEATTTRTFVETFEVTGGQNAKLEIAADNSYIAYLNGEIVIDQSNAANNYASLSQDEVSGTVLDDELNDGTNTLRIEVTNHGRAGDNYTQNPAGVLYRLTLEGDFESCAVTTDVTPDEEKYLIDGFKYEVEAQQTFSTELLPISSNTRSGWEIELYDGEGNLLDATSTDSKGYYYFHVPAGDYELKEVMKDDWTQIGVQDGEDYVYPEEGPHSCEFSLPMEYEDDGPIYNGILLQLDSEEYTYSDYRCDFYNEFLGEDEDDNDGNDNDNDGNDNGGNDGNDNGGNDNNDNNDSGGGGDDDSTTYGQRFSGSSASPGPEQLIAGVATSAPKTCPFLEDHMQVGWENDAWEVTKLQLFLNAFRSVYGGTENPITGEFGRTTDANVKAFQNYYREDVLDPWFELGIVPHNRPTGFVYKTTKWKINSIVCPDYAVLPSFVGENLTENVDIDR